MKSPANRRLQPFHSKRGTHNETNVNLVGHLNINQHDLFSSTNYDSKFMEKDQSSIDGINDITKKMHSEQSPQHLPDAKGAYNPMDNPMQSLSKTSKD